MYLQGQNVTGKIALTVFIFCTIGILSNGYRVQLIARTPGPQLVLRSLAGHTAFSLFLFLSTRKGSTKSCGT